LDIGSQKYTKKNKKKIRGVIKYFVLEEVYSRTKYMGKRGELKKYKENSDKL